MRKLTLKLEDLQVDGFSTTPAEPQRGTVIGHSHYTWCTCPGPPTCDATCQYTCPETCVDTCAQTCWETCDDYSCVQTCGFSYCRTYCGPDTGCGYIEP